MSYYSLFMKLWPIYHFFILYLMRSFNQIFFFWHYLPWIHPPGYGPFKKPNPIIRIIFKTYFFQMHYSWFYLSCHASHIILCLVWMQTVESLKFMGINFHGLSTLLSWFIFVGLLVHLTGMHNVWKLGFIIIQMTWINK